MGEPTKKKFLDHLSQRKFIAQRLSEGYTGYQITKQFKIAGFESAGFQYLESHAGECLHTQPQECGGPQGLHQGYLGGDDARVHQEGVRRLQGPGGQGG